jgi:hypothetical protein
MVAVHLFVHFLPFPLFGAALETINVFLEESERRGQLLHVHLNLLLQRDCLLDFMALLLYLSFQTGRACLQKVRAN